VTGPGKAAAGAAVTFSAHVSYLWGDVPVLERPEVARRAGFALVESVWPGAEAADFATAVSDAGLELLLVNTDGGNLAAGERGFLNVPERRAESLAAIEAAIALRPSFVHVLVGRGGGREHAVDVLRQAAEAAWDAMLLVEHLNPVDAPGYLLPTPQAAVELIDAVGSDRVRLLYDAYHAAMVGADPVEEIAAYADYLGHVHYAEAPGRVAPGPRLWSFVDALRAAGYHGVVGLEYYRHGQPVPVPVRPSV
jgi:hydroxypyruvate isomerase